MEFVHRPYIPGETVAAIATPPGEGGVAIIRISGKDSILIAGKVFSGPVATYLSHTAHYGRILDADGTVVDHALILVMQGPRSYTGEDTVEIHCHGGSLISRRVLEVVIKAGARPATAGEFTFKAFMNGKIDLAQAEAVQELIAAKNELAVDAAHLHLSGGLSHKIASFQNRLVDVAAILEAWVDFPEEGLEFSTLEELSSRLQDVEKAMSQLLATFHEGKIIHEGLSLCLVGSPNVGKSSLMNALLDKERAIVTEIAGTTRDLLEDHFRLNGLNLTLIDTAGIRETEEIVEKEGIRRSHLAMDAADLILVVLDASRPLDTKDLDLLAKIPPGSRAIAIWNKVDICERALEPLSLPHFVKVSAKEKTGIDALRDIINEVIWGGGPPAKDEVVLTSLRHKQALSKAIEASKRVVIGLAEGTSPEFLTVDMRECLHQLGTIIGTNVSEDILSAIFSQFCIGK